MEALLELFKGHRVSLQISLEYNNSPVIHALKHGEAGVEVYKTSGETIIEALEKMKIKLIDYA